MNPRMSHLNSPPEYLANNLIEVLPKSGAVVRLWNVQGIYRRHHYHALSKSLVVHAANHGKAEEDPEPSEK